MNDEGKSKKKKIILIVAIALILIAGILLFLWWRSRITATTMRILRIEGTVTLEDGGKEKTITTNLRLSSGNALSTAIKSLVSIGLDEVKIVTLDENSRAVFNQSGRKLELDLTDGSLFFEVQKPLEDDESFDISTSTMVVGIRGTSGWVSVDGEHESLIVTDGVVHVIGTNPVTGEVKEIDVKAGQRINVYLYNDRTVDSIMFEVVEITERDLPEFVLERLRENRELLEKVCRETGWDKPWILGLTEEDLPKVVMDSSDSDDDGSSEVSEPDIELPDTGEEEPEVAENNEHEGPLTEEELAWAHSHIAIIDPNTGVFALKDMTLFDPAFYAATNPDVVAKYGTDPDALLWHYLQRGKKEGRPPIALRTPTPTPTPVWVSQEDSGEDPYKEEEEPEPTPEPTSTPAQQNLTPSAVILGPPDPFGTNQTYFYLPNTNTVALIDGANHLNIYGQADVTIPMNLTNSSGNVVRTIDQISNFDLSHCGCAGGNNIPAGDFTVTDSNTGKKFTLYESVPPGQTSVYSVTDSNNIETFYPDENSATTAFNNP